MSEANVKVTRGGITESQHTGIVAVMGKSGSLIASYGDVHLVTFARSSAKPVQAIPLVESGALDHYGLEDADLALCCASHSSELVHTERVSRMLSKAGLEEHHLQCGPHIPHSMQTYDRLLKSGQPLSSLYSNCSGKHTGMLLYSKYMGEDLSTYHQLDHPLQRSIITVLSELTEVDKENIIFGLDGCGVPTFGLPILNWAKAIAKFAHPVGLPHGEAMQRISQAIRKHPELVGGTKRFDTDLMKATKGRLLAKGGAEGFMVVAVPDAELGFSVKILDGNARAIPPLVIQTLIQLGILTNEEREQLQPYERPQILNTRSEQVGEIVGQLELAFQ